MELMEMEGREDNMEDKKKDNSCSWELSVLFIVALLVIIYACIGGISLMEEHTQACKNLGGEDFYSGGEAPVDYCTDNYNNLFSISMNCTTANVGVSWTCIATPVTIYNYGYVNIPYQNKSR
jgi:hypothetical protein